MTFRPETFSKFVRKYKLPWIYGLTINIGFFIFMVILSLKLSKVKNAQTE